MSRPDARSAARAALSAVADENGDLGDMWDSLDVLTEYLEEYATPDFVCVMAPKPPTHAVEYPGTDGLREAWTDYSSAFETVRAVVEKYVDTDDALIVLATQIGLTRHGSVEVPNPSAIAFRFAGGQVTRLEFHQDQQAALNE